MPALALRGETHRPAQVCVFYLVLRGLDTVEDDMSIPEARNAPLATDRLRR